MQPIINDPLVPSVKGCYACMHVIQTSPEAAAVKQVQRRFGEGPSALQAHSAGTASSFSPCLLSLLTMLPAPCSLPPAPCSLLPASLLPAPALCSLPLLPAPRVSSLPPPPSPPSSAGCPPYWPHPPPKPISTLRPLILDFTQV